LIDIKVKLSLCLTKHHAMKTYCGVEVYLHALASALDGGEWSVPRPGRFTHSERMPGTHLIGGWMGPRAGLNSVSKRKILGPCQKSNPELPYRFMKHYFCICLIFIFKDI
jgi:hypothetical protein